jgi:hypothetical protein
MSETTTLYHLSVLGRLSGNTVDSIRVLSSRVLMKFGIVCSKVRQTEDGIVIQTADKSFEISKILNIWGRTLTNQSWVHIDCKNRRNSVTVATILFE